MAARDLAAAVRDFQGGDQTAFQDLYDGSSRYIYYTILKSVQDRDLAEDIMQETYLEIYKNIASLKEVEKFRGWAAVIAQNKISRHFRKKSESVFSTEEEMDEKMGSMEEETPDMLPEDAADNKETQKLIMDIVNSLPEGQKEAVISFYYNQMSISEIASALEVPENTVKTWLSRGKKKIKQRVIELAEKHGTKLYAIPFATVMLGLFTKEAEACELSAGVYEAISSQLAINPGLAGSGAASSGAAVNSGVGASAGTASNSGAAASAGITANSEAAASAGITANSEAAASAGTAVNSGAAASAGAAAGTETAAGAAASAHAAASGAAAAVAVAAKGAGLNWWIIVVVGALFGAGGAAAVLLIINKPWQNSGPSESAIVEESTSDNFMAELSKNGFIEDRPAEAPSPETKKAPEEEPAPEEETDTEEEADTDSEEETSNAVEEAAEAIDNTAQEETETVSEEAIPEEEPAEDPDKYEIPEVIAKLQKRDDGNGYGTDLYIGEDELFCIYSESPIVDKGDYYEISNAYFHFLDTSASSEDEDWPTTDKGYAPVTLRIRKTATAVDFTDYETFTEMTAEEYYAKYGSLEKYPQQLGAGFYTRADAVFDSEGYLVRFNDYVE